MVNRKILDRKTGSSAFSHGNFLIDEYAEVNTGGCVDPFLPHGRLNSWVPSFATHTKSSGISHLLSLGRERAKHLLPEPFTGRENQTQDDRSPRIQSHWNLDRSVTSSAIAVMNGNAHRFGVALGSDPLLPDAVRHW